MKNTILLFFLFTINNVFSQSTKAVFSYDNAGNRIKRTTIVVDGMKPINPESVFNSQKELNNLFVLYPNTTEGIITVKTTDEEFLKLENKELVVYDLSGKLIFQQNYSEGQNTLDLSNLVNGTYLVKITASGVLKGEWNVIKR